jgi:hypothetical protein
MKGVVLQDLHRAGYRERITAGLWVSVSVYPRLRGRVHRALRSP